MDTVEESENVQANNSATAADSSQNAIADEKIPEQSDKTNSNHVIDNAEGEITSSLKKADSTTEMQVSENGNDTAIDSSVASAPTTTTTTGEDSAVVSTSTSSSTTADAVKEEVAFKVFYNKTKYDVVSDIDHTVEQFKCELEKIINVPHTLQKVMYKGLAKDNKTLREIGIIHGAKVMIVGSKLDDILAVSSAKKEHVADDEKSSSSKEPLSRQKIHRKVLDKGVPDDSMPGILNIKEALPPAPLSGMLNKHGGKVRLTFKLEQDQIWLGTRERTEKLPMNSIKNVVSEPIEGFEHYHIMGLQLGSTEASRYWIYWVPAQYVDAIKDAVLGKWQYF